MKAVQVIEPGQIRLNEVGEPESSDQAVVAIHQVGICGTDTKILAGKIPVEYPRTMGHEMVGTVVSAPPGFPFPEGTRVLVDPGVSCGWCELCRTGRTNICRNGGLLGRDMDGVFTELITAPAGRLVAVPDHISDTAAGVLQVLGTCVHAVRSVSCFPGEVAVVIGLGVTGQLISQLLTRRGMAVIGVTRSRWKRELASQAGAAAVSHPADADHVVAEMTEGRGPDLVVEAVGTEATLSQAISMVKIGGQVLVYGTITGGDQGLPYYDLYHKELTLFNPRAAIIGDYADGVDLAARGELTLEPIVTHRLSLEEAERAFELVHDSSSLKVLMEVGG